MRWRRPATTRSGRSLGIALLILSLVHTPLPEPDYHNVRHHDGPGEVCEHHDHLLRWHPGAGSARDVAVLHWHWFLPAPPGTDAAADGSGGRAIHAHAPAWLAGSWDDDGPRVAPDTASRPSERPAPCPLDLPLVAPPAVALGPGAVAGAHPPLAFGATFAPGVSLTSLLHRWVC
jgi:hypothetical protein